MKTRDQFPTKLCTVCGRVITWRKKWERDWENVKYCGDKCRRAGLTSTDALLEQGILSLLATGAASICPSQAARQVAPDNWQPLMEPARQAARRLVAAGRILILQNGKPADPSTAKGPIRLALKLSPRG